MIRRMAALAACSVMVIGCGSDASSPPVSKSVQQQFCEKWQACGFSKAGITVETCVSQTDTCLAYYTADQLTSWQGKINNCLQNSPECEAFRSCYHANNGC